MAPTTEIFLFESTDAFHGNPDVILPTLKLVLNEKGIYPIAYYGKQIESPPTVGYVFLNWESYEAHAAVMQSPAYGPISEALGSCIGGNPRIYHAIFSDETVALEKPVTEVGILSLKVPENRAVVEGILAKFSEVSNKVFVYGQMREDENKYVILCGWDSVEAHLETTEKPEVKAGLEKLYSLANREQVYHTKLSQFKL